MATVERRNQGGTVRYRVRWWADGKQRSKTFAAEREAKRFRAVLEGDFANGTFIDPKQGQKTIAEFAAQWFEDVHDLRPTSREQLRSSVWFHVLPEFGSLPLSGVTHAHVQTWTTDMAGRMAASTCRKNVFALRRILASAIRHGYIRNNPAEGVSLPAPPNVEQRFLSQPEIMRLADKIHPRYRAMVLVAAFGGLRFGELCALRRDSVDEVRSSVRVSQTLVDVKNRLSFGPPKTKTSVRTVTLPRSIMAELARHMDAYAGTESTSLLFTFQTGNPIRRAWFRTRVWLPATKRADLEGVRFHDLRHTFVALWVSLGRNAKEVSKVAGHSSVAFTLDRYGHLYDTDDDGLSDRLDALLGA